MMKGVFRIPCGSNTVLAKIVDKINDDQEILALWKVSNIMAIDRMGYNDHGPTHVKIVASIALKMLRLLIESGEKPNIVEDHGMRNEDAEVVVVLASALHDIGHAIHRRAHEDFSLILAPPIIRRILSEFYSEPTLTLLLAEIMHAMIAHHDEFTPLTLEAGVVRVADALDMEKGRARIPFKAGSINIHSVSALAIDKVSVSKGKEKPIRIEIRMNNSAGIYQIDELLRDKIEKSGIRDKLSVVVELPDQEMKILESLKL
ncbi:MAG: HD domain-containing protein [Methanomassiliicoccales archaeon]|nr:HD domain-containing protein [Methanomassiliicoccales archaeon]